MDRIGNSSSVSNMGEGIKPGQLLSKKEETYEVPKDWYKQSSKKEEPLTREQRIWLVKAGFNKGFFEGLFACCLTGLVVPFYGAILGSVVGGPLGAVAGAVAVPMAWGTARAVKNLVKPNPKFNSGLPI